MNGIEEAEPEEQQHFKYRGVATPGLRQGRRRSLNCPLYISSAHHAPLGQRRNCAEVPRMNDSAEETHC